MDIRYTETRPGDIAKLGLELKLDCADRHSDEYVSLAKRFNKDYVKKVTSSCTILRHMGLNYAEVIRAIADLYGENNPLSIKITDVEARSCSLADLEVIDYEHFTGWGIRKSSIPLCELGMEGDDKDDR